jgi:hypothetical protein
MTRVLLVLALVLGLLPQVLHAEARAWLDRDRIALGETTTLNIETGQPNTAAPDYAPLGRDFTLDARSSRETYEATPSGARARTLFAIALRPRREGLLDIPSLQVGSERTPPLQVMVTAAAPARAGGEVFIEAEVDHDAPYVQQAVGYVLRLYYATQLVSGQLDQALPSGAALQRIGADLQYTRDIGGRRYNVVERRFLLVPERSGTLVIPPARFQGRGVGSLLDDFFGDGQRSLTAAGPRRVLGVQPIPDRAPQPWLPLHGLSLRYLEVPRTAVAGEAVEMVVEVTADGAIGTQLPELGLPAVAGMQVFAEPPQIDESFERGRPQVRMTRKFALVPEAPGTLQLVGPSLQWWDVRAGLARTASAPGIALQVAPGAADAGSGQVSASGRGSVASDDQDSGWIRVPGVQGGVRPWALGTVVFALLWLATLAWALHRRALPVAKAVAADQDGHPLPRAEAGAPALRLALESGTLGEVAEALCAMAQPPLRDVDALSARLAEPAQVAAIEALQRARWAEGDGAAARSALRTAFAQGPRWVREPRLEEPLLPPLYPPRSQGQQ